MRLVLSSLLLCALAVFSMATNAQDTSKVAEIAAQLSQNQQQFERDQLQIKAHQDELTLFHTLSCSVCKRRSSRLSVNNSSPSRR